MLPWPDLGQLAAAMPTDASIAARREAAQAALTDVLRGLRLAGKQAPHVLIAHANVLGASCDSGQPVTSGNEIAITINDLMEAGPSIVALGHIHAGQSLVAPVPVFYCGSLFRTTFGESSGRKGYSILNWNGSGWKIEERDGPARRMVLLKAKWAEGKLHSLEPQSFQDAEVRLVVEFPTDEREAVRIRAWELKTQIEEKGAYSVVIEERPVIVSRTRCAEIETARTTSAKLAAWAKATGLEIPEGASSKLAVLEAEMQI